MDYDYKQSIFWCLLAQIRTVIMSEDYKLCPETLQELIESLHVLFAKEKVNVEDVQAVMENYRSNEDDWEQYAKFDHHR